MTTLSRQTLIANVNTLVNTNGQRAISGNHLNTILKQIVNNAANVNDDNVLSGAGGGGGGSGASFTETYVTGVTILNGGNTLRFDYNNANATFGPLTFVLTLPTGVSANANNILVTGTDGKPLLRLTDFGVSSDTNLLSTGTDNLPLLASLISSDGSNVLTTGSDSLAFYLGVSANSNNILSTGTDKGIFLDLTGTISTDSLNALTTGSDRGLYHAERTFPEIATGVLSTNSNQSITTGTDNLLFFQERPFTEIATGITSTGLNGVLNVLSVGSDNLLFFKGVSSDASNNLSTGTDGGIYYQHVVTGLSTDAGQSLVTGTDSGYFLRLISTDASNVLTSGSDNGAYYAERTYANLATGTLSVDASNALSTGSDGLLYVIPATGAISTDANNLLVTGTDGDIRLKLTDFLSTDAFNSLGAGSDSKIYFAEARNVSLVAGNSLSLAADDGAWYSEPDAVSTGTSNLLTAGVDGRPFYSGFAPSRGSMYLSSTEGTPISVTDTYVKASGTTTVRNVNNFTMPSNNRLTYNGASTIHVELQASIGMACPSTNVILAARLVKNGNPTSNDSIASTSRFDYLNTGILPLSVMGDTSMVSGDYIELFVTNETSTANVTVENMYMFVKGVVV